MHHTEKLTLNTDNGAYFGLAKKDTGRIDLILPAGADKSLAFGISPDASNDEAAKELFIAVTHYNKYGKEKEQRRLEHDIALDKRHKKEVGRLEDLVEHLYARLGDPTDRMPYYLGILIGLIAGLGFGILIGGLIIGR